MKLSNQAPLPDFTSLLWQNRSLSVRSLRFLSVSAVNILGKVDLLLESILGEVTVLVPRSGLGGVPLAGKSWIGTLAWFLIQVKL